MNDICADEVMHLFQFSARAVIGLQLKQIPAAVFSLLLDKNRFICYNVKVVN